MVDRTAVLAIYDYDQGPGAPRPWMRLTDNGDGVYSLAVSDWGGSYRNISGAATTVVKSGAGTLVRIVVNKLVSSGVITLYDNTAATGTKIATITNPLTLLQSQTALEYGCRFATGLTVVTSAADDITVIYR